MTTMDRFLTRSIKLSIKKLPLVMDPLSMLQQ